MLRALQIAVVMVLLAGCGDRASPPQGGPASGGAHNAGADAKTTLRTLLSKANDFEGQQKQTSARLRQISGEIDALTLHLKRNGVASGTDLKDKPEHRRHAGQLARLADEFDRLVQHQNRVDELLNDTDEVVAVLEARGQDDTNSLSGYDRDRLDLVLTRMEQAARPPRTDQQSTEPDPVRLDAVLKRALAGKPSAFAVPDRPRRVVLLVDALNLRKEYLADKEIADLKYKGKTFMVRGKINVVAPNGAVWMEGTQPGEKALEPLHFYFTQQDAAPLRSLKKGDTVTIKARCEKREPESGIYFKDAEIINPSSPVTSSPAPTTIRKDAAELFMELSDAWRAAHASTRRDDPDSVRQAAYKAAVEKYEGRILEVTGKIRRGDSKDPNTITLGAGRTNEAAHFSFENVRHKGELISTFFAKEERERLLGPGKVVTLKGTGGKSTTGRGERIDLRLYDCELVKFSDKAE